MAAHEDKGRCAAAEDDVYAVSAPCESSDKAELAAGYMRDAARPMASAAAVPPPPPNWPMLSGVFTFPWYPQTLACWMLISLGLMVAGLLLLFWLGPGAFLGLWGVRLVGLPTCAAALLTFSYAASCCFSVIEETFHGWDAIEIAPETNWKEWVWSLAHLIALVLQAALFGLALQLIAWSAAWSPIVAGTLAAFPFVLLGALAADGAWTPLAIVPVLRSLGRLWWAWGIFYLATTAMIVGWTILTVAGLPRCPWLIPFYSGPLLAALMLIYARLIGRLARLISEEKKPR